MPKVTIEDISRHTGLSRGTVSRALNDRPDISIRTKEKVLEACRKLNYIPSHAARSLATGRNYAIAVLVDHLRSDFASAVLRGVTGQASAAHYATDVIELGTTEAAERVRKIAAERVDALLNLAGLDVNATAALRDVAGNRPIVSTRSLAGVDCDLFAPDYREAGRMVARFAFSKRSGLGGVLFVQRESDANGDELHAGFAEIANTQGVDAAAATVRVDDPSQVEEQLSARLSDAAVLFASDDLLAVAAMMIAARRQVNPAIIGCGNSMLAAEVPAGLTSVDFDVESIGARMMETALQRIATKRMDAPQQTYVAPRLVERGSTRMLG